MLGSTRTMGLTKKQIKGIRCIKEWQLSDYAWNDSQKKMIKTFLKKMLDKWAEVPDDDFPQEVVKLAGTAFYIGNRRSEE